MSQKRFHDLTISGRRHVTQDDVVLTFAVPDALRDAYRFTPGQFLTLRAPVAGEDLRRSYSICAAPYEEALSVAIKYVPGGRFGGWVAANARVGDTLAVMTPDGRFGLPPATGGRLVAAFAAGSGITPILSILKAVLHDEPASRFFLFYGNRTGAGIMFREELEDLKDRYLSRLSVLHVLSREQQDLPALNGRLDAERVARLLRSALPAASIDQALVCGPLTMIDGLATVLQEAGIPPERIHVERFTPAPGAPQRPAPAAVASDAPAAGIASVISEGVRWDMPVATGETIIDAAIRAGRVLPYSCKAGMCCTCRAKLIEGNVVMAANYSLETWETDAGYVLTCQSRATTPRVTLDFDQV